MMHPTINACDLVIPCRAGKESVGVSARVYQGASHSTEWLVLAPGAGANHESQFMVSYATALAERGVTTVTFNFPYLERGRRLPDPPSTLEACWISVLELVRERAGAQARLVAGGKSMGGRVASQVAVRLPESSAISGLVFLGYPLHPPGRPERRRTAHWPKVGVPALFVQGSRDPFASPEELRSDLGRFGGHATTLIVEGGDHSFKVPQASGRPQEVVHAGIQAAIVEWIQALPEPGNSAVPRLRR